MNKGILIVLNVLVQNGPRSAALVVCLAMMTGFRPAQKALPIETFEKIVTPSLIRQYTAHPLPFKIKKTKDGKKLIYEAEFELKDASHLDFYRCEIAVGPAEKPFPFIEQPGAFALGDYYYNTHDGAYTILVSIGKDVSNTHSDPGVDIKRLAQAVSDAYDNLKQQ